MSCLKSSFEFCEWISSWNLKRIKRDKVHIDEQNKMYLFLEIFPMFQLCVLQYYFSYFYCSTCFYICLPFKFGLESTKTIQKFTPSFVFPDISSPIFSTGVSGIISLHFDKVESSSSTPDLFFLATSWYIFRLSSVRSRRSWIWKDWEYVNEEKGKRVQHCREIIVTHIDPAWSSILYK